MHEHEHGHGHHDESGHGNQHGNHDSHNAHDKHDKHAGHNPDMFRQKFWISLLLTVPTLLFSPTIQNWFGYSLAFPGSEYVPAVFGLVIFIYGGMVFLRSAQHELAARRPGMMTLISMAITVAFVYSALVTLKLVDGMDFWWELATLVTIMLFGHWVEMASISNAQNALNELKKLLPDIAERVTYEGSEKVAVSKLRVGDKIIIRPGGQIPVDGMVVEGESKVNESMLTGESKLVKKAIGQNVIGGTLNTNGSLTIEVVRVGNETTLAGIMKLVSEAQNSKSDTQILADKAAYYLFFVAVGAALLTGAVWSVSGASINHTLERVVTVLIIACPHALGLAIPLVVAISTSKAAKSGLLTRRRLALEEARNTDIVLFDKTGTLTKGEQGVVDVIADDKAQLLQLAASVESGSEHPVAMAILATAKEQKVALLKSKKFLALEGRGVLAVVDGRELYVGGPQLISELGVKLLGKFLTAKNKAAERGQSIVYVIENKVVLGAIAIADTIRDESKETIGRLKAGGQQVYMLTGDSEGVARWVAGELGIDKYFAEILPGDKAGIVKELQQDGSKVAMVGDGINDAPALAQADVGIAIGAGTAVAIESAGIVLASSDPMGVAKVLVLSKATYRKMIQNLWWATGYNVLAIPLAAGVGMGFGIVLSPAAGAILMSLSTIVVALNAQSLRRLDLS